LLDLQQKLNRTIIFVSHDLDEAFKLGNRIAIMEGGRIVQHGTPRDIYQNPANGYVADFVSHMNPLGVLCAQDVMDTPRVETPCKDTSRTVPADMAIGDILPLFGDDPSPISVVAQGREMGQITQSSVLARLAPRPGAP